MELETDGEMPFLDLLVIRKDLHRTPQTTENVHTLTITSIFNHIIDHTKSGIVQSLYHRATTICQQQQDHSDETDNLRQPTAWCLSCWTYGYGLKKIHLKKEVNHSGFISIQYLTDISEKFKCIANRYNIKPVCKMRHTLRNSLMRTRLIKAPQEMVNCVCSIPCECGRSHIGETSRSLAARLKEHRWNLGQVEKFYISSTCL
jgi:hypothetical protein